MHLRIVQSLHRAFLLLLNCNLLAGINCVLFIFVFIYGYMSIRLIFLNCKSICGNIVRLITQIFVCCCWYYFNKWQMVLPVQTLYLYIYMYIGLVMKGGDVLC